MSVTTHSSHYHYHYNIHPADYHGPSHHHHGHWQPHQYQSQSQHQNLPDSTVGRQGWLFKSNTEGYGVDLNGQGGYQRGQDGVIAFDRDRNGRVDGKEIEDSNKRLKAFGGNYDLDGNGKVSFCERIKGQRYQREMQQHDQDRDGKLSTHELSAAGGRVLIDQNQDGKFQSHEQHSPYSFPTPGGGQGSIGYVDPRQGHSQVNNTRWGWHYHHY